MFKSLRRSRQTTIARRIELEGVGFHLALPCKVAIRPAPANTGIVFERVDFDRFQIPARLEYVGHVAYSTALIKNGVMVCTVEHLMAGLYGCHVDNAIVEIDSVEVPIMDGSAQQFVKLIQEAGTIELEAPRKYIRVLKPVEVVLGERSISLLPASTLSIDCEIEFDHPLIRRQHKRFTLENNTFCEQLADARTFIFLDEFSWRRRIGQVRGGSPETAVILTKNDILNRDGLRFADEFVRHKSLDILGDIALLGKPLMGQIKGRRSGHALHNALVNKLVSDPTAWDIVSADCFQEEQGALLLEELHLATT